MKPKLASQGSPGSSKCQSPEKDNVKSVKLASQKKSLNRRTPIKLRATTEKYVAKRTRDKSPKLSKSSSSKKNASSPSNGVKSNNIKAQHSAKSKNCKPQKCDVSKSLKKLEVDKKSGGVKAKNKSDNKKSVKTKVVKVSEPNLFIDLWAFASMGKREASLNASMKVNIMYERNSPVKSAKATPKKVETGDDLKLSEVIKDKVSRKGKESETCDSVKTFISSKVKTAESSKEKSTPKSKAGEANKTNSHHSCKKTAEKDVFKNRASKSNIQDGCSRKRKSPAYKIFKEEPPAKSHKGEKSKTSLKPKGKLPKKAKKIVPSCHHLSNIIEKSPRQASLFAKAMIAMEQEEEAVIESAARTRIFDWMELRPYIQHEFRKIRWVSGLQNAVKGKDSKGIDELVGSEINEDSLTAEVDVSGQTDADTRAQENESLHNTLLRTLHQIGDSRLLKEYLRAQKEDFQGSIDVEKCATPEKRKVLSPEPKKMVSPPVIDEKPEKVLEKPVGCPPAKPQPCRVATPIPQFPVGQRTSHMTSYIHHPIAQPMYPQQQHHHAHPQPIKVIPYPPNPAYIYQYAVDRPQSGLYAPPSSSPIPFGVGNSEVTPRDYSSTFTLNHMGSLSLERRGVNPYQPTTYNPSMHLPMQPIGFNFPGHYPASIQALPQQNITPLQPLPLHQQYPLVQPPVMTQHQLPQDVNQLGTYQPSYTQYQPMPNMGQNANCMPPPPAHTHRPTSMGPPPPPPLRPPTISHQSTVTPMESLRSMNPVVAQSITRSPVLDFSVSSEHCHGNLHRQTSTYPPYNRPHQPLNRDFANKGTSSSPIKYTVSLAGLNNSFSPCKKEQEESPVYHCDVLNRSTQCNNEFQPKSFCAPRVVSESSDVSDLLHSAHSTMYQIDGMNSMENIREYHQAQASVSCNSTVGNCSPSKISIIGHASFNASYSVSSILDMPSHKVKCEPAHNICAAPQATTLSNLDSKNLFKHPIGSNTSIVCFATSGGSNDGSEAKNSNSSAPVNNIPQKNENTGDASCSHAAQQDREKPSSSNRQNIIIIDDTDESSDDEPLAKLVKLKPPDDVEPQSVESIAVSERHVDSVSKAKAANLPLSEEKTQAKTGKSSDIIKSAIANKLKAVSKKVSQNDTKKGVNSTCMDSGKVVKPSSAKLQNSAKRVVLKPQHDNTSEDSPSSTQDPAKDDLAKSQGNKDIKSKGTAKKSSLSSSSSTKTKKALKKTKAQPQWPQTPPKVNTNHGWAWLGEGKMNPIPKLTIAREEPVRIRKCYQSMQHSSGEIVSLRDCVILQSDGDGSIPYVAKVSALWENLNGEMMFSMLWFYQPEHTATGREPEDGEQELFASKHREENSVACIDDKCYVLMYNEYCRLEAEAARLDQGIPLPRWREQVPKVNEEDRKFCRPLPPGNTCVDNIWFCRYDYDIRKKLVKKPKHKKSNLRYRVPFIGLSQ